MSKARRFSFLSLRASFKKRFFSGQQSKVRWYPFWVGTFFFFCASIILLLLVEYHFFCTQSERVLQMKEEYRTYLVAVKKVMGDFARAKERIDELELMLEIKKKNSAGFQELISEQSIFSEGTNVYSSDDADESGFLLINREPSYLKKSAITFYECQKMADLFVTTSEDIWSSYTHQLQQRAEQKRTASKQGKLKKTRVCRSAQRVLANNKKSVACGQRSSMVRDISLDWPLTHFWLSSRFGSRKNPDGSLGFHYGIDLAAPRGTPVFAAAAGVVIQAQRVPGYGNLVVVAHNRKYRTRYAHLDEILVRVGSRVSRGDIVGKVGATGFVRKSGKDGSHLHFELLAFSSRLNPLFYLR